MSPIHRRHFLQSFSGAALASLLHRDAAAAGSLSPKGGQHTAKAKRVIQIFCPGGMSHVDTFDYKPELIKRAGKPFDPDGKLQFFASKPGNCQPSFYPFKQHGECGRWISGLFPKLAMHADDMAFIYSMQSKTALHGPGCFMMNTGQTLPGFPSMGAWVTYGLGSESDNLPAFVVLPDPRGLPPGGPINWGAGFLPAVHQATALDTSISEHPIADLFPHPSGKFITPASEAAAQQLMAGMNRAHAATREGDQRLDARIRSYELAARMQLAAPEALDLKAEPDHVLKLYGLDRGPQAWPKEINPEEEAYHFSSKCLTARRLLERGVRFVQVWSGNDNSFPRRNWDSHEDVQRDHGPLAHGMACGIAAFIKDLKQRGLFDDTLILWTTEFGRMPSSQGGKGRDHNPYVFTNWLGGGGIRGGVTHGESDHWGYKPLERAHPTLVHDIHATLLHQLGLDHTRLTFRHNGVDRRLTDVHGHVIHPLLA